MRRHPSPPYRRSRALRVVAVAAAAAAVLAACSSDPGDTAAADGVECDFAEVGRATRPVDPPAPVAPDTGEVHLDIRLSDEQVIPVTLDRASAPCSVASTVHLARSSFFVTTACHRLTTAESGLGFLQCGDPSGRGDGGPGYAVPSEPAGGLAAGEDGTVIVPRGTVVLADRRVPDSGGSQFFLVHTDTALDTAPAVLGRIDDAGLAVLDEIAAAGSDEAFGPGDGHPAGGVRIRAIDVTE